MDILSLEDLMRKRGILGTVVDKLARSTRALPPHGLFGSWSSAPAIAGLSAAESELLLVRMLERVSAKFGASLSNDIPELYGLPDVDDLLGKISNQQVAELLKRECDRLKPPDERCRERV